MLSNGVFYLPIHAFYGVFSSHTCFHGVLYLPIQWCVFPYMLSNGVFYLPIHAIGVFYLLMVCFIFPYMLSNGMFYLPIHAF